MSVGRRVILFGRFDLEVELAFAPTEEAALGGELEPDQTRRTGCDTDGRWVEGAIDPIARVDEMQPAAREVVAVVLDHELERWPAGVRAAAAAGR